MELHPAEVLDWLSIAPDGDLQAVEAFLIGACAERTTFPAQIRTKCQDAQIFALEDKATLETTLELFAAEIDDVLKKPVHVKEILARVGAHRRRKTVDPKGTDIGQIQVFFDGRDPVIAGEVMELPRRERRILEYLVRNKGRRVTKTQIFNAVYGLMNDGVDECVVESHISKLRKKMRQRLGFDAIESTRYIGYMLKVPSADPVKQTAQGQASSGVSGWGANSRNASGLGLKEAVACLAQADR
nr:response regulator transcription factor [Roseibium hamelinense]